MQEIFIQIALSCSDLFFAPEAAPAAAVTAAAAEALPAVLHALNAFNAFDMIVTVVAAAALNTTAGLYAIFKPSSNLRDLHKVQNKPVINHQHTVLHNGMHNFLPFVN